MTDDPQQQSFDDLKSRLNQARQNQPGKKTEKTYAKTESSGFSQAFRIGTDMVSAVLVGTAIGWFLDNWLETKPWFLIIFIFLGGAAGILNVYRSAMQMTDELETEWQSEQKIASKSDEPGKSVNKVDEK